MRWRTMLLMACDDGHGRGEIAVCYGYASVGRYGDGRTDAWHYLEWNACFRQGQSLFTAAPKHERVAPFQTHHAASLSCVVDKKRIDLFLLNGMMSRGFAGKQQFGVG